MFRGISAFYSLLLIPLLTCLAGCDADHGGNTYNPPVVEAVFKPEGWEKNKGIGPVQSITLDSVVDQTMAAAGAQIYKERCTTCHKLDKRFIGPPPKGVLERRTPEWVMNMILNPEEMVQKDPIARELVKQYDTSPMTNQHLSEEEARKVLEYFRTL